MPKALSKKVKAPREKSKRLRCTPTSYCFAIENLCHNQDVDKVGLHVITYIDMPSGKVTLRVLCYRQERGRRSVPMALNHCPMCGFDMSKRKDWRG